MNLKWLLFLIIWIPSLVLATSESDEDTKITVIYEDSNTSKNADDAFLPKIEEIFQSSLLTNGLNSGADVINRSVESLMEVVFYNLMDNEAIYKLTEDSWLTLRGERKVYSTAVGGYVVVDQINFGPNYYKELWKIHEIPINLGIDGSVQLLEIYPRSDAGRIWQSEELPPWRKWLNNWFGLLPLLTRILPPSFNSNELYDPARQVEASYSFPLSVDSFYSMPIGSIRSYGLTGGVKIPLNLTGFIDAKTQSFLSNLTNVAAGVPYTIFTNGIYRINVLRKSKDLVWVGLSTIKQTGHSLAGIVGNTLYVLGNAIPSIPWAGLPVPLFPIDIGLTNALRKKYDQLFEFDMSKDTARQAYLKAVKGDFELAGQMSGLAKGLNETGVTYHFLKTSRSIDSNFKTSRNVFVTRQGRIQSKSKAEVKIKDNEGEFHILEASEDVEDTNWDLLVGNEEIRNRLQVEMNVEKISINSESQNERPYKYIYARDKEHNILSLNLQIKDRYTDTLEYITYVEMLKNFLKRDLSFLPKFPKIDLRRSQNRRKSLYLVDPGLERFSIHSIPLVLGRFNSTASIKLGDKELKNILNKSENEVWRACAVAFDLDPLDWSDAKSRSSLLKNLLWLRRFVMYPLRLFNVRSFESDSIAEMRNFVSRLRAIRKNGEPEENLDAFDELFSSDHPDRIAIALLELAGVDTTQRSVSFYTKPATYLDSQLKNRFGNLNGVNRSYGRKRVEEKRLHVIKEKLSSFFPTGIKDHKIRPHILSIEVLNEANDILSKTDKAMKDIVIKLKCNKMVNLSSAKIYVKLEHAGKVQIGNLVLIEDVAELSEIENDLKLSDDKNTLYEHKFTFYLNGIYSPFESFILTKALEFGGEFQLTISVSSEGDVWSDEKTLTFGYRNGNLAKPE
ncbi:MAG: hypothetical protein R3B45_00430 [Bdellovibrionota bacterium]